MTTDQPDAVVRCPYCPVCGEPPVFLMILEQTFCLTETCEVFCWDMTVSAADNLTRAGEVRVTGTMQDGEPFTGEAPE